MQVVPNHSCHSLYCHCQVFVSCHACVPKYFEVAVGVGACMDASSWVPYSLCAISADIDAQLDTTPTNQQLPDPRLRTWGAQEINCP